jgi:DNA polymerase elongation subunit (family B)
MAPRVVLGGLSYCVNGMSENSGQHSESTVLSTPLHMPEDTVLASTRSPLTNLVIHPDTWQCSNRLKGPRRMVMRGVCRGSNGNSGERGMRPTMSSQMVMGYDLEMTSSIRGHNTLPLPCDEITCCCVWSSHGHRMSWHTPHLSTGPVDGSIACKSSKDLCIQFMAYVHDISPDFLVGYNNHPWDNQFTLYHTAGTMYENWFIPALSDKSSPGSLSFILDIPGVNNVDAYSWIKNTEGSQYQSLSLYNVSRQLEVTQKGHMQSIEAPGDMIEYCMVDAHATCDIWIKIDAIRKMYCMSSAFRSCTLDTMVYSTGIMTSCLVSSTLLERGCLMDWSKCEDRVPFAGGYVSEPDVGVHFDVMVADFESMYPNIMIGCNISVETVRWRKAPHGSKDGSVSFLDDGTVECTIGDEIVWFDGSERGNMCGILETLISVRSKYKRGLCKDSNSHSHSRLPPIVYSGR